MTRPQPRSPPAPAAHTAIPGGHWTTPAAARGRTPTTLSERNGDGGGPSYCALRGQLPNPGTSSIFVKNCSQGSRKASAPLVKLLLLLNFQRSGACSSCSLVKFSYQLIHLFSKICSTLERIKEMGQVLSRDLLYDCKAITEHLSAMLLLADEEIRSLKK